MLRKLASDALFILSSKFSDISVELSENDTASQSFTMN